ncbi:MULTISPECIES: GNAT family N-acetyltransferase [unclassified Paenibacillus]|uniref:GNAT family N-acetyltransferase n=1 Tax=unclassified Paenibacillus TaxID=185978 RepID=UPI000956351A|nr:MULTISPECIES: GNAT family N-acetyltransferase [unclassified Paenibacillus]ASS68541.1 GNAT family N-acetyltransferase [Paenibacillus sp. RUD330]SIR63061.1 Acetyltransferase (GNAT) domain-containing protein [Paenibacillus sp. RU4X]SIR71551.1 Acetyltransferase (GNAT) domain-containing protein [Paenibacillus sp. RU4T]
MNPSVHHAAPAPEEYIRLRKAAGLSAKSPEGAAIGLRNSIYCVSLRHEDRLIGMGRIIGDGGCFYQIVDIAVDPAYQGIGLGKLVMAHLTEYLDSHAPKGSYVSLIADVPADRLYKQYGFDYTEPASVGMYRKYSL